MTSKTVSPIPKKLWATDLTVGSEMPDAFGEKPLDRRTPATTVDNRAASIA